MKKSAFWWDIDESLVPLEYHNFPKEADFVVEGGGYTGLSAGLAIARRGHSVIVLDGGNPGFGASTRNGGICSGNVRLSHGLISKKYGETFADEVYAEAIEARLDLTKFCEEVSINCELQMTGRFTGALSVADYDTQAYEAERLNKVKGHKAYMVDRKDQHSEIATDLFHGGMVREEIGGFHPAKFFVGLLRCAEKAGVCVFSNTTVIDINNELNGKKSIITKIGTIISGKVITVTNAYTGTRYRVGRFLRKRLVPLPKVQL